MGVYRGLWVFIGVYRGLWEFLERLWGFIGFRVLEA